MKLLAQALQDRHPHVQAAATSRLWAIPLLRDVERRLPLECGAVPWAIAEPERGVAGNLPRPAAAPESSRERLPIPERFPD